jgi:hypothetical protein
LLCGAMAAWIFLGQLWSSRLRSQLELFGGSDITVSKKMQIGSRLLPAIVCETNFSEQSKGSFLVVVFLTWRYSCQNEE